LRDTVHLDRGADGKPGGERREPRGRRDIDGADGEDSVGAAATLAGSSRDVFEIMTFNSCI
jgi:hypothetical protein